MEEENYVKILFQFYSDVLEEETVETMWATVIDKEKGLYKLDNIPFYAPNVATDDIVYAEFEDSNERLTYRRIFEPSGNSTIQVILFDDNSPINEVRALFDVLGCTSERVNDSYFVMDVPFNLDYTIVQDKLKELEDSGVLGYAEPCLSENHNYNE